MKCAGCDLEGPWIEQRHGKTYCFRCAEEIDALPGMFGSYGEMFRTLGPWLLMGLAGWAGVIWGACTLISKFSH